MMEEQAIAEVEGVTEVKLEMEVQEGVMAKIAHIMLVARGAVLTFLVLSWRTLLSRKFIRLISSDYIKSTGPGRQADPTAVMGEEAVVS